MDQTGPGRFIFRRPDGTVICAAPLPAVTALSRTVEPDAATPRWGGETMTPYALDVIIGHLYQLDYPAPPPVPVVVDEERERELIRQWRETPLFPFGSIEPVGEETAPYAYEEARPTEWE